MKTVIKTTDGHSLTDLTITLYGGNTQVTKYASFEAYDKTEREWLDVTPECGYYYEDDYEEEDGEKYYFEEGDTWKERLTNYIVREIYGNFEILTGINLYDYKVKVIYR